MSRGRQWMELVLGILLGLSLGLAIAWWLAPNARMDLSPAALRPESKDEFRLLVASVYTVTGDLNRARNRLSLIRDTDMVQSLIDEALRFRAGQLFSSLYPSDSEEAVFALANLANSLQQSLGTQEATPLTTIPPVSILPTPTFLPFELMSQEAICTENDSSALAMIQVRASTGQPLPGVEIIITWEGGRQHIFTGLKPAKGYGYADFIMSPGVLYSVQLIPSSTVLDDLVAPDCIADDGTTYPGVILLIYEQP